MRYKLNFKGFYDTPEMLFGNSITEALDEIDFGVIEDIVADCITTIKTKLSIELDQRNIESIQFINIDKYAAALQVVGQYKYLLLINPAKIPSKEALISSIYHELCHMYQLDRLFKERIIFYDYIKDDITTADEDSSNIALSHLNTSGGHTEYWQELADKINNSINPEIKITAYLTEEVELAKAELFEEDYFKLDFTGFYD